MFPRPFAVLGKGSNWWWQILQDLDGSGYHCWTQEWSEYNGNIEVCWSVCLSPYLSSCRHLISLAASPRGTEAVDDANADDRFLNIRLDGIQVDDPERHPHMVSPLLPIPLDHACLKSWSSECEAENHDKGFWRGEIDLERVKSRHGETKEFKGDPGSVESSGWTKGKGSWWSDGGQELLYPRISS